MVSRVGTQPDDIASVVRLARAVAAPAGTAVEALILGAPDEEDVRQAALAGAAHVWLAPHPGLADDASRDRIVTAFALALTHSGMTADPRPTLCLFAAGPAGEEMAARLAVRNAGIALGRCAEITLRDDGLTAIRTVCGGRARLSVSYGAVSCFSAMRVSSSDERAGEPREPNPSPTILHLGSALPDAAPVNRTPHSARDARLESARIVVSGGRGIGGSEGFALLRELSEALGAALGGSLPTVDAGWIPVARQIGQSGKFVAPEIYVAVAISGTPQHLAGIGPDVRIAAINSDAEAEIFRFAEIGIVGDWHVVVPALLNEVKRQADTLSE